MPRPASRVASISDSTSWCDAAIDGTGRPPSPRWKPERSVENPSAPPSSAATTTRRMVAISASVASRSYASSPSVARRTAVCPTYPPKFTPVPRSATRARYSGCDSNDHSIPARNVATRMSSTPSRVRSSDARCSGGHGAIEYPQFPATTAVTPCAEDGMRSGSHSTCGS